MRTDVHGQTYIPPPSAGDNNTGTGLLQQSKLKPNAIDFVVIMSDWYHM